MKPFNILIFIFIVGLVINIYSIHSRTPEHSNSLNGSNIDSKVVVSDSTLRANVVEIKKPKFKKIPTFMLPSVVVTKERFNRLDAINDTWGLNDNIELIIIPTENPDYDKDFAFKGIDYNNDLYHKLLLAFDFVVKSFDYDWICICNDHTFIVPENLQYFLKDLDPTQNHYLGHALRTGPTYTHKEWFNSGAAGLILSKESFHKFLTEVRKENPSCLAKSKFELENPGMKIGQCMMSLGIFPGNTQETDGGFDAGHNRFNTFGPVRLSEGTVDEWYINYHSKILIKGVDCCAKHIVSFHYCNGEEHRILYKILYNIDNYKLKTREELMSLWPSRRFLVYSNPPASINSPVWDLLLKKFEVWNML